tara:strand:+ start:235 stop:516 length:282 start_codon:yes stop_codon:yes gene_type:complete
MALTKTTENDQINVVKKWNIQVRTATIIKEDSVDLSRTFNRRTLVPGTLHDGDNFIETDISSEDADVQAICNAAWTTQVKADYKAFLIATKDA